MAGNLAYRTLSPHANLRDDFVHLIASCDLLIHGLLHSLVVAFLAAAVRSNRGLRTAIIRMLVFHRSTSALPVHGGPLRGGHSTPACPSKTTCPGSQRRRLLCEARGYCVAPQHHRTEAARACVVGVASGISRSLSGIRKGYGIAKPPRDPGKMYICPYNFWTLPGTGSGQASKGGR